MNFLRIEESESRTETEGNEVWRREYAINSDLGVDNLLNESFEDEDLIIQSEKEFYLETGIYFLFSCF